MLSSLVTLGFVLLLALSIRSLDLCSQESTESVYFAKNLTSQNCGCDPCIRKCCKPGYLFLKGSCYNNSTGGLFSVPMYKQKDIYVESVSDIKYFLVGVPKCNMFRLNPSVEDFYVQTDFEVWVAQYGKFYSADQYCVDESGGGFTLLLCAPNKKSNGGVKIQLLGMIISMPFLLITFVVYALLPESNIHRKALMCYVLTLLIGYVILVGVQLNEQRVEVTVCHLLGYGIVYFFIASFFWMNVMCVDMWLAFSGMRGFKGKKSTERKRFLIYCGYAFGVPLILILVIFLANTYGNNKSIFHPHLGISKCFLDDGYPNLLYFYLPMAIIIGINVTLFILTALKIQKVKNETSMLHQSDSKRHSYEEDKQKFNLYLKLLFAMGINWTMEVISWAVGWAVPSASTYIWYLTDFANASYGVFIFFIFVFKRKIWITLKKRYYNCIGKPHLAHALSTSTRQTRTSHYSTTDTTVSTDYRLSDMKNGKAEERPLNRN